MSNKLLVVIGGPTGVGKSAVAIQIARHYGTEIINADSRQIYRELNIGVGKPDASQLAAVPHHLISHASIFQPYSAGHYATDALNVLYTIFARHDIAILSGGTGLYIKSVIEGFDAMPDVPEDVTQRWTNIWENEGLAPLIEALKEMDPDYLAVVDQSNHARLIRAAAVSEYSGMPFSSFRSGSPATRPFKVIRFGLDLPRKELYAKIDQRVVDMINAGWMEEVESLHPHRHLKALQTVGYQELFDVIDGTLTLDEAIPKIQQSTRHYAKRQMTWWRHQGEWMNVHPDHAEKIIQVIG